MRSRAACAGAATRRRSRVHVLGLENLWLDLSGPDNPAFRAADVTVDTSLAAIELALSGTFSAVVPSRFAARYLSDLGIALTDVVGMDAFLADFDLYFAKLFDGLRHDSGDPVEWGEKALAHYARLRLDAHTRRLVFSDGLDFDTLTVL